MQPIRSAHLLLSHGGHRRHGSPTLLLHRRRPLDSILLRLCRAPGSILLRLRAPGSILLSRGCCRLCVLLPCLLCSLRDTMEFAENDFWC